MGRFLFSFLVIPAPGFSVSPGGVLFVGLGRCDRRHLRHHGDVRTIRIGRQEFESMIRERPDVSLAMMRVLAERLGAETRTPG